MSETEIASSGNLLPELSADISTSDDDKALMGIWNKHNGPDAELKDPAMPDTFVTAQGDHFDAAKEWTKLSMKDRQQAAAVHREFADLKKQGEALGMKTETAADIKAVKDMVAGKERAAPIDMDTQASLDTFRAVVPFAKDHKEASTFLNGWVANIQRDPDKGWSDLLKAQGMGHLLRDNAAPATGNSLPVENNGVAAWAAKRGVSVEDQRAMGDIVSQPTWREIAGESLNSTLDRAHKALQRSRGRLNANGRQNRDMDAELHGIAADIYRR